ncbi:hypothetical protein OKW38_002027 [Paraburkholderia sp. MM5496-R1]|uniref:hypothetical protein n=1 Tax=Paraburkholderia sp. MM5496-R1 TaxID=2991065 RepID=UPI003D205FB1
MKWLLHAGFVVGLFISDLPGGAIGLNEPEWPDRKFQMRMSEYPCSYLNKAVLKFPRQDRKKSQIVSVKISAFFMHFVRQLLPQCGPTEGSGHPISALSHGSFRFANSSGAKLGRYSCCHSCASLSEKNAC